MFCKRTCEHTVQIADAERTRTRIWKQPTGADNYGDKTGYNKTERAGDNDWPGSHPNREKNQLKYRYDARLFTLD